mmetsp:Transcript_74496/g.197874  ORF Transcript_74496/g.197874 Transcript_74496/m.197874 type:complete len:444 (-) Transcript_74496:141-1472(-)
MGQVFTHHCVVAPPTESSGIPKIENRETTRATLPPPCPSEPVALPPVEVCTRFSEVSSTARIPEYTEHCNRLPKGRFLEVPNVLQVEGLTASFRIYPNGDEDAAHGRVSIWLVLASRRAAMLSASVSLTNSAGAVAMTQSFGNAELSHETTLYGWTSFCDMKDMEYANVLEDGALHLQVNLKFCAKSCPERLPVPEINLKAAPDHVMQLRSDLRDMRFQTDGDVVLVAEGKEHSAHQAILKARSPVLRVMLEADMAEKASGRVVIDDLNSLTVSLLLDFLYTADIPPNIAEMEDAPEELGRLMKAADKYEVPNLMDLCIGWLKRDISRDNMLKILEVAHEVGNPSLKEACLAFVTRDSETVQAAQDSRDFEALPSDLVRELFVYASGNNKRRQANSLEFPSGTDWMSLSHVQLQRACDERALSSIGERLELLAQIQVWESTAA